MKTIYRFYTYIIICLCVSFHSFGKIYNLNTHTPSDSMGTFTETEVVDAFAKAGSESLQKLMEQNSVNNKNGESFKNSYVFGFDNLPEQFMLPPNGTSKFVKQIKVLFSEAEVEQINVYLRTINTDLESRGKPLIYLGIDNKLGDVLTRTSVQAGSGSYKALQEASKEFVSRGLDIATVWAAYRNIYEQLKIATDVYTNTPRKMEIMQYGEFLQYNIAGLNPNNLQDINEYKTKTNGQSWIWCNFKGFNDSQWSEEQTNRLAVYEGITKSPINSGNEGIIDYFNTLATNIQKVLVGLKTYTPKGRFGNDFYKPTGEFYQKIVNSPEAKALADEITDLETEMMDDPAYNNYLKVTIRQYLTTKPALTLDDLTNLKKALLDLKEACKITYNEVSAGYITTILNYLSRCQDYNGSCIGEGGADGYIPQCIWDNPTAPYPVAFSCGIIDGAIGTVAGIGELAVGVVKFQLFLNCWNPLSPRFYFDTSCKNTREETKVHFKQCWEIVSDWDNFKNVVNVTYTTLTTELGKWSDNTFCTDRACCYYNMGKAVFDIGSLFFGIGELKAASKGFKLSSYVSEFGQLSTNLFTKAKILKNTVKFTKNGAEMALKYGEKYLFYLGPKTGKEILRKSVRFIEDGGLKVAIKKSARVITNDFKNKANTAFNAVKDDASKLLTEVEEAEIEVLEELATNPIRKGSGKIKTFDDLLIDNEAYIGVAMETLGGTSSELIAVYKKSELSTLSATAIAAAILIATSDPDPDCTVCETKSADIKTKYQTLCVKARRAGLDEKLVKLALNNMCNNLSNAKLLAMYDRLIEEDLAPEKFNSLKLKEFLSDLVIQGSTCVSKVPYAPASVSFNWIGLPTYLSQLDTPMLNAWLIYFAAERPCLRQSLQHLSSLSEAYLNTNLKKTPFNFTFDDFKKTSMASGGQASRSNESDAEVFTNLRILADKNLRYRNSLKFGLKENLISAGFYQVVGANFVMRYINNNTAEFMNKFVIIEDTTRFSEAQKDFRVTDVRTLDPNTGKNIYYEFKSYLNPPSGNFCNQWIRDLGLAQNASELKWIFDGRRLANHDMTVLKTAQLNELITTKSIAKFNDINYLSVSTKQRWFANKVTISVSDITDNFNNLFGSIFSIY